MNFLKVVFGDFKNISRKKLLILAVCGISLIPIVYGGLYLAAFWDPYSKSDTIAVGVVNLDSGAVMNGKKHNYGKDIVNELKKNKDLQWHFKDDFQSAQNNLKNEKYYAVLVIPQNFSQRLASADKGVFKKPELMFATNKKTNYVVGIISDKASTALQDELNKNIINNIAVKLYNSMEQIKDGMYAASDGSLKIKNGIGEMKDQIPVMSNGVGQLYDGADMLSEKIGEAAEGGSQLKNGIGTLNGKMPDLVKGVTKLFSGSSNLANNIGKAEKGSNSLKDGINTLNGKIPDLADGVGKLYDGSNSLESGLKQLNDNMPDLLDGVGKLKDGSGDLKDGIGQMREKLLGAQVEVKQKIQDKEKEISSYIKPSVDNIQNQLKSLQDLLDILPHNVPGNQYRQYIEKSLEDLTALVNQMDNMLGDMQNGTIDAGSVSSEIDSMIARLQTVREDIDPVASSSTLPKNITELARGIQQQIDLLIENLEEIKGDINNADEMLVQLNTALNELYDGSGKLNNGLDELYDKSVEMKDGVGKLYDGSQKLTDGIGELKGNIPGLQQGVNDLSKGAGDLSEGLFKIHNGSMDLQNNLGKLNDSMPGLQSGVQQIYDGSTALSDGLFKLSDGAVKIKNGLKTLKDQIPKLQAGVDKLYNGVGTLHDKLADGAEQLAGKLTSGSKTMADFVSDPVNMNNKELYKVSGYGEGLAPYFISLGLWVGALLMFFVITDKPNVEEKVNGASIAVGKYIVYGCIGILQAILLSFAIVTLGLRPSNIMLYYSFNIFLSLVFIAIMQNFVFLFGDLGRVLSILTLILQLTSSGGTFPGEMLPDFFRIVGPFLPFYYSVSALREIIWGVDYTVLSKDIKILSIFFIVPFILTIIAKQFFSKYIVNINMRDVADEELDNDNNNDKVENIEDHRLDKAQ